MARPWKEAVAEAIAAGGGDHPAIAVNAFIADVERTRQLFVGKFNAAPIAELGVVVGGLRLVSAYNQGEAGLLVFSYAAAGHPVPEGHDGDPSALLADFELL